MEMKEWHGMELFNSLFFIFDIYEKIEIPTRQLNSFKFFRNMPRHKLEDLKEKKINMNIRT